MRDSALLSGEDQRFYLCFGIDPGGRIIAKVMFVILPLKSFFKERIITLWPCLLIALVFFLLRLYNLGYHDLWYDEIGTVSYARYPWSNWNAPFYWILLHFWMRYFGISEFALRFPSVIFSFFSVALTYLLGRDLFNKKAGVIASIFMGLSPFHLWYAQEARDYSMVLFFGVLSSYLFFRAIKEKGSKTWLFFTLVSIIGIYTNYFYIFLFLAQGLYLAFFRKMRFNLKGLICFLIIAAGFSFYLPRFLEKFNFVWAGFWIPKPTWRSLIITLENFILGYNGTFPLYLISDIFAVIFFISAIRQVKKEKTGYPFLFCASLFFIPIILAFFFSKTFFSVYLDRGLIIFSPFYYLILASGICYLKKMFNIILLPVMLIVISTADYRYFNDKIFAPTEHHRGAYIKKPIKPIAGFLNDNVGPEDILGFANASAVPSLEFYSRRRLTFYWFFDPKFLDSNWQRPIQENKYCVPFYKIDRLKFKRLYVIYSNWERDGGIDENSQSVKDWLDNNLELESSREFDGLWICIYRHRNA